MKAKLLPSILFSVIIIAVSVFAIRGLLNSAPVIKPKPPVPRITLVEFKKISASDERILLEGFGRVASRRSTEVVAQVKGSVKKIFKRLEPGTFVRSGERLLEIDGRDYKVEIARKKARLGRAVATLKKVKAMAANIKRMEAIHRDSYNLQLKEVERTKSLLDSDMISQSVMDRELLNEKSKFERLQSTLNENNLLPMKIEEAAADVDIAEAEVATAWLNLERTIIVAPFDGVISSSNVAAGKFLSVGAKVVTIEDTGRLEVMLPVSVDDYKWLEIGRYSKKGLLSHPEKVVATWVDGIGTEHSWDGLLTRVSSELSSNEQAVNLYIDINNTFEQQKRGGSTVSDGFTGKRPLLQLKSGMFVRMVIPGKQLSGVVRIPRSSLRLGGDKVFLVSLTGGAGAEAVNEKEIDGSIEIRKVNVMRFQGDDAFILDGLDENDLLITSPVKNVVNGQAVRAVPG